MSRLNFIKQFLGIHLHEFGKNPIRLEEKLQPKCNSRNSKSLEFTLFNAFDKFILLNKMNCFFVSEMGF